MQYPNTIPFLVISYAYEMIASHGSVARTISIRPGEDMAITGGSPDLERPYHSYDKRYVSLQEFINGIVKNSTCN